MIPICGTTPFINSSPLTTPTTKNKPSSKTPTKLKLTNNIHLYFCTLIFIFALILSLLFISLYKITTISEQNSWLTKANQNALSQSTQKLLINQIFYPNNSTLIKSLHEMNLLRKWTGNHQMQLIFKSSIDGDSIQTFHSKIKDSNNLVLIETTKGFRFGVFTSLNFHAVQMYQYDFEIEKYDKDAFLFSLDTMNKYVLNDSNKYALIGNDNIIIHFGKGDLIINDGFLSNESELMFSGRFNILEKEMKEFNGEENKFVVKEMEVFHILT